MLPPHAVNTYETSIGNRYGLQRMCGAAGYGVAALVSGVVYGGTGGGYGAVVAVFVAALTVSLVAAIGVPVGTSSGLADGKRHEGPAGGDQRYDLTYCVRIDVPRPKV